MNKSIQYFNEKIINKMQQRIIALTKEESDIGHIVTCVHEDLMEFGRQIISEILEEADLDISNSIERKKAYEKVYVRENSILTTIGRVSYKRTCFKNKKTGKTEYLADRMFGIKPHENLASDVEEEMIKEAVETSYRKSGEEATKTPDQLSKQTVMNYVDRYGFEFPEYEDYEALKRKCRVIYIEADEDHVSLQDGGNALPRLVYVHEGIEERDGKGGRNSLKNTKYFSSLNEESSHMWERVLDYIYDKYDWDAVEKIYISGDGAGWIRAGTRIIDRSRFVLDRFHMKKYIKEASAHMAEPLQEALRDALYDADKEMAEAVIEKIMCLTEDEDRRQRITKAANYFSNNWDGISIYSEERDDIVGCSAEGHVSHVYSSRLSSRPKGWNIQHVKNIANLRVYMLNGGKIEDLVRYRRSLEASEQEEKTQREKSKLISRVRNDFYMNASIPILSQGKRTQMSWLLKEIRGVC